jgi:hypothetical protein
MRWHVLSFVIDATTASVEAAPLQESAIRFVHRNPRVVISNVRLRIESRSDQTLMAVKFDATATYQPKDTSLFFDLPRGSKITGLVIRSRAAGGIEHRETGKFVTAEKALTRYEETVQGAIDPGLMQWHSEQTGAERFELRVFPLGVDAPMRVEFDVALPFANEITIDSDGQLLDRVQANVDGKLEKWRYVSQPLAITVGRAIASGISGSNRVVPNPLTIQLASRQPKQKVDQQSSLLAVATGAVRRPVVLTYTFESVTSICSGSDSKMIRSTVRQHHSQLRYCYTRVAQANPKLAGTVSLHFVIRGDGHVDSLKLNDGDGNAGKPLSHPDVLACIESEVNSWRFPAMGEDVEIRYPLQFRLAE